MYIRTVSCACTGGTQVFFLKNKNIFKELALVAEFLSPLGLLWTSMTWVPYRLHPYGWPGGLGTFAAVAKDPHGRCGLGSFGLDAMGGWVLAALLPPSPLWTPIAHCSLLCSLRVELPSALFISLSRDSSNQVFSRLGYTKPSHHELHGNEMHSHSVHSSVVDMESAEDRVDAGCERRDCDRRGGSCGLRA